MTSWDADLIILGGGAAGLSLASRLADAGAAAPRTVVIDPRQHWGDDRTWCFWRPPTHDLDHLVADRWDRWRLSQRGGDEVVHDGGGRVAYQRITAGAFYADAFARIDRSNRVEVRSQVAAGEVVQRSGGVEVATDGGALRARSVVDTRPPSRDRLEASTLLQVFAGVEVAGVHVADPATLGLMVDMHADEHGFRFLYVLPFGPDRALVEATRFAAAPVAPAVLRADVDAAVATLARDRDVDTIRSEAGVLPMGLPRPEPAVDGVVRAGTGGGGLRAATGYGFLRMSAWAQACAAELVQGRVPVGHPPEPRLRGAMDATFLRALRARPADGPAWFLSLAASLGAQGLVRFLSDGATLRDLSRVVRALPPGPLLTAALAVLADRRRSPSSDVLAAGAGRPASADTSADRATSQAP